MESVGKRQFLESVKFDANNNLEDDVKIFKSDTFENYKSFVPIEVQNQYPQQSFNVCDNLTMFLSLKSLTFLKLKLRKNH